MKVQIGRNATGRKYPHHLQHDVSTTSAAGFCQPILAREMNSQDTAKLRIAEIVRLTPLVLPTFGKIKLKTYTSFVKTEDIYHAFGSLLSGQSYHGNGESYIPGYAPYTFPMMFNWFLWMLSDIYVYQCKSVTTASFSSNFSSMRLNSGDVVQVKMTELTAVQRGLVAQRFMERFNCQILDYEVEKGNFDEAFDIEFGSAPSYGLMHSLEHDFSQSYFDQFIVLDENPLETEGFSNLMFCCKYSTVARNLRKILIGLRYGISYDTDEVEVLRLFAYYKAYFDLFFPNREKTWKNTAAFHLLEKAEQTGDCNIFSPNATTFGDLAIHEFIANLCGAYYTINPDYASAHIIGTAGTLGNSPAFSYLDYDAQSADISSAGSETTPLIDTSDGQAVTRPALRVLDELTKLYNKQTAIGGDIGAFLRIEFNMDYTDECESQLLGTSILDLSPEPVINQAETAQGALGEFAGACVGSSTGEDDSIHFTAKTHGYLISFFAIVPDGKLAQGVDPCIYHTKRFDFFDQSFDAITLLPSRKAAIYGSTEINDLNRETPDYGLGFGNMMNYSEYAVIGNVVNGEISQRSKRASYMPFTIDKLLPYSISREYTNSRGNKVWDFGAFPPSELVAGIKWRYIGKIDWFGIFNRVFLNSGNAESSVLPGMSTLPTIDDNYIIQMYLDFHVTSYKLPLSLSFDTDGFGDSLSVEKA